MPNRQKKVRDYPIFRYLISASLIPTEPHSIPSESPQCGIRKLYIGNICERQVDTFLRLLNI